MFSSRETNSILSHVSPIYYLKFFCIVLLSLYRKEPVKKAKNLLQVPLLCIICACLRMSIIVLCRGTFMSDISKRTFKKRAVCPFEYLRDIKLGVRVFIAPVLIFKETFMSLRYKKPLVMAGKTVSSEFSSNWSPSYQTVC